MTDDQDKRYDRGREHRDRTDEDYRTRFRKEELELNKSNIIKTAEEIVDRKLRDLFGRLGYNIEEFAEIRRLNKELEYLRTSLESSIDRKLTFTRGFITSLIGGLIGIIVSAVTWIIVHR